MKVNSTVDTNPIITRWLLNEYGIPSIDLWIENTVKKLLDLTKQRLPPIKLEPLFPLRNIMSYPKDYSCNNWEVRFTMAHEIAHTFYFDIASSPPRKTFPSVPRYISEALCNSIAAEILMPKWMVKEIIKKCFPSAESHFNIETFRKIIVDFVQKFNVSPNVVARRLIEGLNLWDVLVLGIGWCSQSYAKEFISLGMLEIEEIGFTLRVNRSKRNESNARSNEGWRLEWYAKPPCLSNELFIPSIGNPSIDLEIVEQLYLSLGGVYCLENKECLRNFRLGNLTKHLKKLFGNKEQYPVYACFLKKYAEAGTVLPLQDARQKNICDSQRYKTKIVVCIPFGQSL
ncbi:MAG TPA: ImmA/IrrE family metallo-endopeptidase [Candidatus Hypogeohydataceae bacterium YC40]